MPNHLPLAGPPEPQRVDRAGLEVLFDVLRDDGYTVIAPTLGEDAIVLGEVTGADDLPAGWTDEQAPGRYRLQRRSDQAVFGYASPPTTWKRFLYPPEVRLWRAERSDDGAVTVTAEPPRRPRYAFVGVRACDLAAIGVLDRVLLRPPYPDPIYRDRRDDLLLVAVHCTDPAGTCFCVSMSAGPRAAGGFDLALTEVPDPGEHHFVVEAGTPRGASVLARLPGRQATAPETDAAAARVDQAAGRMGRTLQTEGLREALQARPEDPRWDEVADRCLTCGNCVLVCPTCFCTVHEETSDVSGRTAERWRKWDTCYDLDHSYIHGGSVRSSPKARYRQWATHKLSTWHDQFGTGGCIGCGRCITWCPVGIDITEEASAVMASGSEPS